jgi:DMSO/TMAO reductase YedYZ molybdopterin-dependent catalytic subunit
MPHSSVDPGTCDENGAVRTRALVGALAAAAAIAVSQLAAAVLNLRESPVLALAQTIVELTPGATAESVISVVGTYDKPLAVVSVLAGIVLLGALLGRAWERHRALALAGAAVATCLVVAAVLTRPYGSTGGVVASLLGGATLVAVLSLLVRDEPEPGAHAAVSRRTLLRMAGAVAIGTVLAGGGGELLAARHRRRRALENVRAALRLPTRRVAPPAGVDFQLRGQPPWLTPNRAFYRIDTALTPPLIEPEDWTLRIHGMVERELTLTYQDLLDRGLVDAWITVCCVSNEVGGDLISTTLFSGVPMRTLLEEVGVKPGADALLSTSDDGWTCGTPLSALTDGRDAMLAVAMNGEALPVEHGFPVRQVVPGLYGYVSATKWVREWEVTRFADFQAYWTQRGWGAKGPVKTQSRIDLPPRDVAAGVVPIAGVAWAQHTGVAMVEVRIDEGAWTRADLAAVPNDDTWVQWKLEWDAPPGDHVIEVRATDTSGSTQTAERSGVLPDGATGHHRVEVSVS